MGIAQVRDQGAGYAVVSNGANTTLEADSAHVIPAANIVGGFGSAVPTAGRAFTLDTAANLDAAQPRAQAGDVFQYVLWNNSGGANAITFVTGAGITLKPAASISVGQNKTCILTFVKTGNATYDCYQTLGA